jgi:NADPH2:quinone reductase
MGNISVLGVILGYGELPVDFRRFGLNMFPAEVGRDVHGALLELLAAGSVRPVVGRQVSMDEVAGALDDHEQRRTMGRTVVVIG